MKKVLLLILIFLTVPACYAQDESVENNNAEQKEIHLDLGAPPKKYNLQRIDNRNNPEIEQNYENEMPIDVMTAPLRMLRQLQPDMY